MAHRHLLAPWLGAGLLIALAAGWRLTNWHWGVAANLELVTAVTLLAAAMLPRRVALIVPLGAMVATDLVIGNTAILVVTWSAYGLIGLGGWWLRRFQGVKLVAASVGGAAASSVFFFAYTNFGVWLEGLLYPRTLAGLVDCYLMALPFYRTQLIGNLIFVPTLFALVVAARQLVARATPWTKPAQPRHMP